MTLNRRQFSTSLIALAATLPMANSAWASVSYKTGHYTYEGHGSVNTHWIETPNSVIVIDVQRDTTHAAEAIEAIRALGKPVSAILITHGHPDHYVGVHQFQQAWPGLKVFASPETTRVIETDHYGYHEVVRQLTPDEAPEVFVVPDQVFAHGWWTNEGQKISKSIGNVIKPEQLIETYGLDQTRYFLLREVPFGNDGNFSSLAMVQRINSDLANTIGNLAQRTLSLAYKYCDAAIPTIGEHQSADREVLSQLYGVLDPVREAMDALKFHHALELILERARLLNEYIDAQAPWALRKTDQPLMETVLHTVLEGVRVIGILLQPFIPDAASHLLEQLGISQEQRSLSQIHADHALQSGTAITAPSPVFPRFDSLDKTG